MLFNSLSFALFLPVVFLLYWWAGRRALQNQLLLATSYFFYACWDWRFLGLLLFTTLLDYTIAFKIAAAKTNAGKKTWLAASIGASLGVLGFFKYYDFFAASLAEALHFFGVNANLWTLNLILPVGISFYTFHGISYVMDVYRHKIEPEKNFVTYALFVGFFPLLVAGPIERAAHLLPQLKKQRVFYYGGAVDGLRQMLWGFFKKLVIADSCAVYANRIFDHTDAASGSTLLTGAVFFAFQIYGDFSGYSDIAIGTARLFGIELLKNFAFPYFSRSIPEFWRRWHISLTSWFRDYLYIPLGGNSGGLWRRIRNVFIIFLVSGFWHGAAWTFVAWGALNAVYMIPALVRGTNRNYLDIVAKGKHLPSWRELFSMLFTFLLTVLGWIFFRAKTVTHACLILATIVSPSLFAVPHFEERKAAAVTAVLVSLFLLVEWRGRAQAYALAQLPFKKRWQRWLVYAALIFFIGMYMQSEQTPFIYFQF